MYQNHIKRWFNRKYVRVKRFDVGDLVLKWDKPHEEKSKQTKFQPLWMGPFRVEEKLDHNAFKIKYLNERIDPLLVNGQDLKHYFQ